MLLLEFVHLVGSFPYCNKPTWAWGSVVVKALRY